MVVGQSECSTKLMTMKMIDKHLQDKAFFRGQIRERLTILHLDHCSINTNIGFDTLVAHLVQQVIEFSFAIVSYNVLA